jgi:hypothetical protein
VGTSRGKNGGCKGYKGVFWGKKGPQSPYHKGKKLRNYRI